MNKENKKYLKDIAQNSAKEIQSICILINEFLRINNITVNKAVMPLSILTTECIAHIKKRENCDIFDEVVDMMRYVLKEREE